MDFYFGTYDSENFWRKGDYQTEIDINKEFVDEVMEKYGHKKALKGWYISHEVDTCNPNAIQIYRQLSEYLKSIKNLPVLISPYIHGVKMFGESAATIQKHKDDWSKVFDSIEGLVDIVAFQDGNVDYCDLEAYLSINKELSQKHDITFWSNIENFDRDMLWKFPPISFPKLLYKMQMAEQAGVDKMITFEFSHFMSPNSSFMEARNLYERYKEWLVQK